MHSTVVIYCTLDGKLKLLDSHARNAIGMPRPPGTCLPHGNAKQKHAKLLWVPTLKMAQYY